MSTGVGGVRQGGKSRILVVDADARMRSILTRVLGAHQYEADSATDAACALELLGQDAYAIVLFDADSLGADELRAMVAGAPAAFMPRVLVMANEAVSGFECIMKPLNTDALLEALASPPLTSLSIPRQRLIGRSPEMEDMFRLMERVAPTRATVLVQGETGTGKELVARSIHDLSPRGRNAFVPVNCSALPDTLLESELFGHTRGSFTGAIAHRRGLFEEAQGGTLFLDEVSTLSQAIQVKLLRVLQERVIRRVGSSERIDIDFRLIAASNTDLGEAVAAGRFREDLYYRLNVFPITVPPLRDRAGDIPLLVSHFRLKFSRENGLPAPAIGPDLLGRLSAHHWPGNVRELENFVERAVIMQAAQPPRPTHPPVSPEARPQRALLEQAVAEHWDIERMEHEYITAVLEDCGGNRARAARILGIDPRTLYRKLRSWGA